MAKRSDPAREPSVAATQSAAYAQLCGLSNPFALQLEALIRAGFQAALVTTAEYTRVEDILKALVARLTSEAPPESAAGTKKTSPNHEDAKYDIVQWDCVNGFSRLVLNDVHNLHDTQFEMFSVQEQTQRLKKMPLDPVAALQLLPDLKHLGVSRNAIVVMHDFHYQLANNVAVRSLLQNMSARNLFHSDKVRRFIVFQQNSLMWPPECEHCVRRVELPLPDDAGMEYVLDTVEEPLPKSIRIGENLRPAVIRAVRGLGARAAEDVLSLAYVERGNTVEAARDALTLQIVERYKADAIRTDGLTYVPREQITNIDEICGYDAFIDTLRRGAQAYRPDAKAAKIDTPRGYVLIGVPGSGKSQIAYAAARALDMPLVMFDPSQMLGSLVGQTEQRVREAFRTIEAQRGCVVVIDELDKMLVTSNGASDGGVSMRMFGMILRWLQERRDESIVIVTLNRTSGIDPELFRSGRFDGTYGVGLPDAVTRRQIIEVHFAKRGVPELLLDPDEWDRLSEETDGLLGSDMEEIVKVSRAKTLQRLIDTGDTVRRVVMPSFKELLSATAEVKEQSITRLEASRVAEVCKFVEERCRPVHYAHSGAEVRRRERRALGVAQTHDQD